MLREAVGLKRLNEMLATMTIPDGFTRPNSLEDFTFHLYTFLLCSKRRWREFQPMFLGEMAAMRDWIERIAIIRNVVFHFKRPVSVEDVDELRRFRTRLHQQRESFHRRAHT